MFIITFVATKRFCHSHCRLGVLDGAVPVLAVLLDALPEEPCRQHLQLRLPAPDSRQVVDDAGVDDVGVHHAQGVEVRVEGLAHQDCVLGKEAAEVSLHVGEAGLHVGQHLLGDAGEAGQVVGDAGLGLHKGVVNNLRGKDRS